MGLLQRLFGTPTPPASNPARWVVLDVETTGLDTRRDDLLAIAALAVHFKPDVAPCLPVQDSFEAELHRSSDHNNKNNILLHGIGVGAQRAGRPPAEVLTAFEAWVGDAPLVAFHAPFDQAVIGRAMKLHLQREWSTRPWLDLAPMAAALFPQQGVRFRSLDDWLQHFGIPNAVRHQAAADTLATAELLLRLWPAARQRQCTSFAAWASLARHHKMVSTA